MLGDTWYHVVLIYCDGDNEVRYYVGGSFAESKTIISGPIGINSESFRIGRTTSPKYFKGTIDDVRVCNRVLANVEIQQLYQSGLN